MSEKNLLDKMSLIDVDYVEKAVYPEVQQRGALTSRKWWKAAVATAAALAVGVCCVSFSPQIRTFAGNLFIKNAVYVGDEPLTEANLNVVKINDVDPEAWDAEYYTLEEVEELLGITLLKSSQTLDSPIPMVTIGNVFNGQIISIWNYHYYAHNEVMDLEQSPKGDIFHVTGDNPYQIEYYARFHSNYEDIQATEDIYEGTSLVENYTTANGLEAKIFHFNSNSSSYTAIIYHDNIRYEFTLDAYSSSSNNVTLLEEYLETIS